MERFNRRRFLALSSLAAATALAACGGEANAPTAGAARTGGAAPAPTAPPPPPTSTTAPATAVPATAAPVASVSAGGATAAPTAAAPTAAAMPATAGPVTLRWWDHFSPLQPLHKSIFDAYRKERPNVSVDYTLYNLPQLGQSLQVAFNSKQAPDVHAIASITVPTARLVKDGWFAPLDGLVSEDFKRRFPPGILLEGLHTFGGKLYSFPLFGFRSHSSLLWFNKQLAADGGFDPEAGPRTWDEFRQAAGAITKKGRGQVFGWVQAIQLADRLGTQVMDLAMTAGAPGPTDPKTGEYRYHADQVVQAVEFLRSFQGDGSMFPASTSLDARTARARFSTGIAGFNLDGPWSIGVIRNDFAEFADKIGVAQVPVPDAGKPGYIYRPPNGGDFWVSSQSKTPAVAAQLLERFNTGDYYVALAERMDQPPLDLAAAERANVHPAYKKGLKAFADIVKLAPSPVVKNPAVADVLAEMRDIRPNFGEIVQGFFGGNGTDYRTPLKEYSDKLAAERDAALKTVQGRGVKVSVDDWVFPNWDPAKDYTAEFYK